MLFTHVCVFLHDFSEKSVLESVVDLLHDVVDKVPQVSSTIDNKIVIMTTNERTRPTQVRHVQQITNNSKLSNGFVFFPMLINGIHRSVVIH
jgi:transcriptional regulator of met regulon